MEKSALLMTWFIHFLADLGRSLTGKLIVHPCLWGLFVSCRLATISKISFVLGLPTFVFSFGWGGGGGGHYSHTFSALN